MLYNALNYSYEYNDASGGNFTGASAALGVFVCPSTPRGSTRDTASADPNASPYEQTQALGYGYMDYAPSVYTDINVQNGTLAIGGVGATPIVPYRNKLVAALGLLKNGKTAISEVTDGLSNTIAILECAGRDERFVSQFFEGQYPVVRGQGPAGGPNGAAPVLAVGRPGLGIRHVGSTEQQGRADQRRRALGVDHRNGRKSGGA